MQCNKKTKQVKILSWIVYYQQQVEFGTQQCDNEICAQIKGESVYRILQIISQPQVFLRLHYFINRVIWVLSYSDTRRLEEPSGPLVELIKGVRNWSQHSTLTFSELLLQNFEKSARASLFRKPFSFIGFAWEGRLLEHSRTTGGGGRGILGGRGVGFQNKSLAGAGT